MSKQPGKHEIIAKMLENQQRFLENQQKSNKPSKKAAVGDLNSIMFPIIRAAFPTGILNSLVSVQPMNASFPFRDIYSESLREAGIYCL